jgi:hypothetical protein
MRKFKTESDFGAVAELADALDLGSSTARCAGSTPVSPISLQNKDLQQTAASPFFSPSEFSVHRQKLFGFAGLVSSCSFPTLK